MSTKVKRYGWKKAMGNMTSRREFATKTERDADAILLPARRGDWTKYSVLRTPAKPKGRPLWWAIRQLREGRYVRAANGALWGPQHLGQLLCNPELLTAETLQSWTLAEVQP